MNEQPIQLSDFEEAYSSVMQIKFMLADPTFMVGELGRGSGKSTKIIGSRADRIANAMPGSKPVIAANTYVALLTNILPAVVSYFKNNYIEGIHYVFGKQPPQHFKKPEQPVLSWKHTIATVWGTVFEFVSIDRPESALGKNAPHIIIDEALRAEEQKTIERLWPILRGDRHIHGHSHFFGGFTIFSSSPNGITDHDWWCDYKEDMDDQLIAKIINVAYRINDAYFKLQRTKNQQTRLKLNKFIQRWQKNLNKLRAGATFYGHASSFANIKILGLDYIKRQAATTKDFERFKTSILAIRSNSVKDKFFGTFSRNNIFSDSYTYKKTYSGNYEIDTLDFASFTSDSSYLKYCDARKPLIGGWDPGAFMSLVIAQKDNLNRSMKIIKDMYVYHPEQHSEMAEKFNSFFYKHVNKHLVLHYDRAGNKRHTAKYKKYNSLSVVDVNETDVRTFKYELEKLGWRVTLKSIGQATIFHWQHYRLCKILFEGSAPRGIKVEICENECENLISSINYTSLKPTAGEIEMDKTPEKNLSYKDQVLYSPQIASAMTYLIFGEYSSILREKAS